MLRSGNNVAHWPSLNDTSVISEHDIQSWCAQLNHRQNADMQSWFVVDVLEHDVPEIDATISEGINDLSGVHTKLHYSGLEYCIHGKYITSGRDVSGVCGVNDPRDGW